MDESENRRLEAINTNGSISNDLISLYRSEGLVLVMNTPKGRGVFANKRIPSQTIIEVCPVLVLNPTENEQHVRKTDLYNYTYNWPYKPPSDTKQGNKTPPTTTQAIILGLGSMFNHSKHHQNIGWTRDVANLTVTYTALRDIQAGEELCISYGARLTFVDADAAVEEESENASGGDDWTGKMSLDELIV